MNRGVSYSNVYFTDADIADIIKDFASHRAELPIMFIATEYNKTDSFYTRHHPTPMNLQRLVQLAFKSITALELLVTTDAIKSKNFMVSIHSIRVSKDIVNMIYKYIIKKYVNCKYMENFTQGAIPVKKVSNG